ncbi:hypothetical protein ACGFIV_30245 [Sphaerisporangium sp. NPDC049003]|uniref:hypothetical protein n=1 Tax=Sphaerisporangium sp. NPDC049003 TaxID=3364517 RepID=UPI00371174D4
MVGRHALPALLAIAVGSAMLAGTADTAAAESRGPLTLHTANGPYPPAPDTEPPTRPRHLMLFKRPFGPIVLKWGPSSDNFGVVAYDVYGIRHGRYRLIGHTSAHDRVFVDHHHVGCWTARYYLRARDAAGNVSHASNVVSYRPYWCE